MKAKSLAVMACILLLSSCFAAAAETTYRQGIYKNVQRRLLVSPDNESLANPSHHMNDSITIDASKTTKNASYITLKNNSIVYKTTTDYVPMQNLTQSSDGKIRDYEYRGKMILFGEEYVVKDVDTVSHRVIAYRGTVFDDLTSQGFLVNYSGYYFKAGGLNLECDHSMCWVVGGLMQVRKPNLEIKDLNVTISRYGVVDDLAIAIFDAVEDDGGVITDTIAVYNTSDSVVLEDGAKLVMAGQTKNNWQVSFAKEKQPFTAGMDISEYGGISINQELLSNIQLTYKGSITLSPGGYLPLPKGYRAVWDGSSLTTQTMSTCTSAGDYPPCGSASLSEVIQFINLWASGNADLADVVRMINLWRIS